MLWKREVVEVSSFWLWQCWEVRWCCFGIVVVAGRCIFQSSSKRETLALARLWSIKSGYLRSVNWCRFTTVHRTFGTQHETKSSILSIVSQRCIVELFLCEFRWFVSGAGLYSQHILLGQNSTFHNIFMLHTVIGKAAKTGRCRQIVLFIVERPISICKVRRYVSSRTLITADGFYKVVAQMSSSCGSSISPRDTYCPS